jgi:hypothetical protein
MLLKLRAKAHAAYEEFRLGKPRFLSPPIDSIEGGSVEDDLTMLGSKSRLVRVKEKHGTPSAASPPSLHSHEGDNSSSSMEENSPRPAASDYHPALAEYLKAYNQQLQHQQTHGATPGSPDELRPGAIAGAIALATGDMHVFESSGSATSGGSMSNSSGNTAFDYAYAYGLTEQKLDFGAMARGDSNTNYQISSYSSQQIGNPGMPPQFRPEQLMDGRSPPYFGGHGSPAQYSRHQSPLSWGNSSPIIASLSNPPLSESSESQAHSPIPPSEIPPQQPQHSQSLPPKQSHLAPSQQMAPTSSTAPSAQYYADTFQNPHTPFSAFEPAFMAPRRDDVPNASGIEENDHHNMSLRPPGDPGFPMPPMQLPPLDISTLGQPPDSMDLSWQLMSDLRPYL